MSVAPEKKEIGPLKCILVGNPAEAQLTVIFCHGYGAPGTDLVPLADELYQLDAELVGKVAFVFPQAPHSLSAEGIPGGKAWWAINMARLQQILETNQIEELIRAEPPGIVETRALFLEFLDSLKQEYQLNNGQLVLGGFSQGAMLTTDIALRLPESPAGLCIYSGTMICAEEWIKLVPARSGLTVLQTHGQTDPVLPFAGAEMLRGLFEQSGLNVKFWPFMGGHTIPWQALELTVDLLKQQLKTGSKS